MALDTIFKAFGLALGQIGDPRFRRVLLTGVGLTLALLVGGALIAKKIYDDKKEAEALPASEAVIEIEGRPVPKEPVG